MPDLTALVAACVAAPDDDEPRLVWADAVGGERGEFVVIQCALSKGGRSPDVSGKLRRRARELLQLHGKAWSQLEGIAKRVMFRRGFVEAADIDTLRFVDKADEIFARAPLLRSLTASGLDSSSDVDEQINPIALSKIQRLSQTPALRRLTGLFIAYSWHAYKYRAITEVTPVFDILPMDVAWVRALDGLTQLRAFGGHMLRDIETATFLGGLERLWPENEASEALFTRVPSLTALDLTIDMFLPKLPASVRELSVTMGSPWTSPWHKLAVIAAAPYGATLDRLEVRTEEVFDLPALAGLRQLRSLRLTDTKLGKDKPQHELALEALPPLPSLRELRVCAHVSSDNVNAIAERFGAQLELLDLRGCPDLNGFSTERVAGEVRVGPEREYEPLLHAGDDAAWFEETCITI
jgi:uncharacterized protein (TIGR02996 family)